MILETRDDNTWILYNTANGTWVTFRKEQGEVISRMMQDTFPVEPY